MCEPLTVIVNTKSKALKNIILRLKPNQRDGFALVVTILMMVLLSILAVGMLSLSAVSLRSSSQGDSMAEARANARMALMIAIGRLQEEMGPDQRISANGAIVSDPSTPASGLKHPNWTGVWDSWKAGATAPSGGDEPSHHATISSNASGVPDAEMHPTYEPHREDHFRSWLVSLDRETSGNLQGALDLQLNSSVKPQGDQDGVTIVAAGSLGTNSPETDHVTVPLVNVLKETGGKSGRYGWWVGDESQKANIMDNSYKASEAKSLAEKLSRQQAPASMGYSEISGLENVADQAGFSFLPSRKTLTLVNGATRQATEQFHHITTSSLGVLADVREGGLKRDLSTILERTIEPEEVYDLTRVGNFDRASSLKPDGDDFMLYNFDALLNSSVGNTGEAAVPIQDLAAYYQLYDRYRPDSMGGIQYSSNESSPPNNELNNGIMVSNPDYGRTATDDEKYLRQYTSLYRRPVPVKIEMILSYSAEPRLPADIARDIAGVPGDSTATPPIPAIPANPDPDTHKLRLGISPAITFWNPNNVPLVMNIGNPDQDSLMMREVPIPLKITFNKSESYSGPVTDFEVRQMGQVTSTQQGELYTFFVSGRYPTVFEPGESKVFALRSASNTSSGTASNDVDFKMRGRGNNRYSEAFVEELEIVQGWRPDRFIRADNEVANGSFDEARSSPIILNFKATDYISVDVEPGQNGGVGVERYSFGNIFHQKSRHGRNAPGVKWNYHSFGINGRHTNANDSTFTDGVVYRGFPLTGPDKITDPEPRIMNIPAKEGRKIIDALGNPFTSLDDLPYPFFYYGMKAATETHESNNFSGPPEGAARRFPTRPFTHSTAIAPALIDRTDPASLYNYPWNWFFMPLDNMLDAPLGISGGNRGYYGGGYTAEHGATHVVQQQLPVTPPISIATLSHAHLGGFSLGTEPASHLAEEKFSRTTALGHGGLAPHTLQAIGNSYAHPNIPPEKALTTWTRQFEGTTTVDEPFADHSYLANKALWDEFFFSSISPIPEDAEAFSGGMTAQERAHDFFIDKNPLPNPRIISYDPSMDVSKLDDLFVTYDQYKDGFADKIAGHLMVEGPFNINSTSVPAWKALFSSLKGQQVSYLDAESALGVGMNLDYDDIDGVPLTGGPLPNGKAYQGSSSDPSDPEQWTGFRELTNTPANPEIDELATAMVKQVKLRGPFLSLSDFINRRLLDVRDPEVQFALKGALQAAIDDPDVSINEGFREPIRNFTDTEKSFMAAAAFPGAMEGPVAYGSSAYVDQADILRSFPAQLTPRGDTFVIRAYGDSIDAQGNIAARAWCEAIVQRIPAYVDTANEPQIKQADPNLTAANRIFGRKLSIVQFRWLNSSEI